jgi:hypothetical protein
MWRSGNIPQLSLVFGIDGGEWLPSCPGHYIPAERHQTLLEEEAEWVSEPIYTI